MHWIRNYLTHFNDDEGNKTERTTRAMNETTTSKYNQLNKKTKKTKKLRINVQKFASMIFLLHCYYLFFFLVVSNNFFMGRSYTWVCACTRAHICLTLSPIHSQTCRVMQRREVCVCVCVVRACIFRQDPLDLIMIIYS